MVSTTYVHEVGSLHTDVSAIIQTSLPTLASLGARWVRAAVDALPAIEVCGASESCQANLVFKAHGMHIRIATS